MHTFVLMLLVPLAAGLLAYSVNRLRNEFSFIGAIVALYYAVRVFIQSRHAEVSYELARVAGIPVALRADAMSGFILLCVAGFAVLILLFSLRYMRDREGARGFFFFVMLGLACSNGVLLAANLLVMLFFWGALLVVLYGLLLPGREGSEKVAAKALVIVGLSDFAMMLGIVLVAVRYGWIDMVPSAPMPLQEPVAIAGYLLIAAGALAKAGSMPLHSWIPAAAETAPASVMAYIPASLDKLLGIYLLTRLSVNIFDITSNLAIRNTLMVVGVVTILGAVMMALVQKRIMKLLSFHAVSQVGYMVLGIGTGIPVGIAGGLFHMLNHSVYKAGLFLSAGSVEMWGKTDEIDELGGLAGRMPVTFLSFLIAAMAIAGVPPLNGFVSKWMVYQGVIELAREGNKLYPVFLVAAMLGSVLTLASFLKLIHSMFLGQRPAALARTREAGFAMWLPPVVLAAVCIIFGVFAQIPLQGFVYPSLPFFVEPIGTWQPVLATLLMLASLGIGLLVYLFGTARRTTAVRTFVGGEMIADDEESRVTGTAFYTPVKHLPILDELLKYGERGAFDIYNWLTGALRAIGLISRQVVDRVLTALFESAGAVVRLAGRGLSYIQNGSLPLYAAWVFIGATMFLLLLALR
ncbi:NADH-quinone oxidoreductase subunit L [candidate division WOR-3 bacterium]|nr:NADH-quinone oxidoreductase subunit L [candidate division WOR-3 bacterium]